MSRQAGPSFRMSKQTRRKWRRKVQDTSPKHEARSSSEANTGVHWSIVSNWQRKMGAEGLNRNVLKTVPCLTHNSD